MTMHECVEKGFVFDPGMGQRRSEFVQFLEWLEKEIHPERILEIGAGRGGSTHVFCQIATQVVSIDFPGSEGGSDFAACSARNERLQREFPSFIGILADSHQPETLERAKAALDDSVDALFIDGDHTYAGVQTDLFMYRPLVRPGGVIAFHDINSRLAPDVAKVWQTLKGPRLEFTEHADWGGIGVVFA